MQSSQTAHPIFTFADGEMGPISNTLIRSIERFSGQPKIRKLYFDYVEEDRPYASFWADALDKLSIKIDLQDRKSTRLNSSHSQQSRMPSSA